MARKKPVSLYQAAEPQALSLQATFRFRCHAGLSCFNRCCRAATVLLSPFDILGLKNFLDLSTGEFLARYTLKTIEDRSGLPLFFLDVFRSGEGGCPFLRESGCTVYPVRPAACRLFPITMGSELTPTGVVDYYFCRRLEYCRGFDAGEEWTVASWQADQRFAEYDAGRREWLEILLRQGFEGPRAGKSPNLDLVATLAYDLDQLRRWLADPGFRVDFDLEDESWQEAQSNDPALLQVSQRLLRRVLCGDEV